MHKYGCLVYTQNYAERPHDRRTRSFSVKAATSRIKRMYLMVWKNIEYILGRSKVWRTRHPGNKGLKEMYDTPLQKPHAEHAVI